MCFLFLEFKKVEKKKPRVKELSKGTGLIPQKNRLIINNTTQHTECSNSTLEKEILQENSENRIKETISLQSGIDTKNLKSDK
jgi:hypothetical protein